MEWLWLASAVLLLVVAPVVIVLLSRLVIQLNKVNHNADDVLARAGAVAGKLEAVPKLVATKELVSTARGGVGRYGTALRNVIET